MREMIAAFALITLIAVSFTEARIDPCSVPIERGMCHGYFPSWGMDANTGECMEFVYGGCGGNLNRFTSREQCEEACAHIRDALDH